MTTLKENIKVDLFSFIKTSDVIAHKAFLFQVSPQGFYLRVNRKDLLSSLRENLNLDSIHKKDVVLHIPEMDIELDGVVAYTRHIGRGIFEIFIEFFDNAPQYWRQCLLDMLYAYPEGEFSKLDTWPNIKPPL